MFAELTTERLRTLETLRCAGVQSIYALAKALGRNYSNVHGDVQRLMALGLVERDGDGVRVPFDDLWIRSFEHPSPAVALLDPRQVGKTTLAHALAKTRAAIYIAQGVRARQRTGARAARNWRSRGSASASGSWGKLGWPGI